MNTASKAFALVLITGALVGGGYRWGSTAASNAHAAEQLQAAKAATEKLNAEIKRGEDASGALQLDLRDMSADYQTLESAFNVYKKRPRLLAPGPVRSSGCAADSGTTAETAQRDEPADLGDPALSRGAVWMWNSAQTGSDAPEGACGLADQSDAACAAAAGVTLADAWDNHTINAKACAIDRARHQHLINFIQGKP